MKRKHFTDQEVIQGKNKADLGGIVIKVEYLEYEYLNRDIKACTKQGEFTFRLASEEVDRIEELEDSLTAGDILNAGWESLDTSDME